MSVRNSSVDAARRRDLTDGTYLTDGASLFWVAGAEGENVLLEDCFLDVLSWVSVKDLLGQGLTVVRK